MVSAASGLIGCLKVCMEASNGPCTHIGCCVQRQRLDQWHCSGQAVEMIHNNGTQCKTVHLAADGMSCNLEKPKSINCKLLHWAWEGVFRPVLQRVMSLISINPHQMLCAETAVSPVALLQSSC